MFRRPVVVATLVASLLASPALAAPRPSPPADGLTEAPLPDVSDCANPAKAKAIADNANRDIEAMQNRMWERNKYIAELQVWKSERLIELKAWTREDARAFAADLRSDPDFVRLTQDNLAQLEVITARNSEANDLLQGPDDAAACRAVIAAMQANVDMESNVGKQWAMMDARFDVAARAKGVTLD